MKALERELRELKRANEILRKASALFAQADRPPTEMMVAFVDQHRDVSGVESICALVLVVGPREGWRQLRRDGHCVAAPHGAPWGLQGTVRGSGLGDRDAGGPGRGRVLARYPD